MNHVETNADISKDGHCGRFFGGQAFVIGDAFDKETVKQCGDIVREAHGSVLLCGGEDLQSDDIKSCYYIIAGQFPSQRYTK